MQISIEKIRKALEKLLSEWKGKRNFLQSVEMIVNFRGVDFSKPENRLNLDIVLPKGRGKKKNKVMVIGKEDFITNVKKLGVDGVETLLIDEVPNYDLKKVKKLAKEYYFLADPRVMGLVAKHWGRVLGPRGKIPKPAVGDLKKAIEDTKNLVRIQTKGKYLPTVQAFSGEESMSVDDLAENAEAVLNEIKKKVPEGNIKSVYFKLTMSPAIKLEEG